VEETTALLSKVIAAIDIAIFSFDDGRRLRLLNPAGERLLGRRARDALGRDAAELGLADCLEDDGAATTLRALPGGTGRYEVRRFGFRQDGRPNQLLAITDLSRALREEERQAWQRLIRVLGHELNNSLAPIKSMSGTLAGMVARDTLPDDWRDDLGAGLSVIADRADALSRFVARYSALARLPPPRRQPVELRELLQRVVALEQRLPVQLQPGEPLAVEVDPDQLEQALINLVKNAVEAALPERGEVEVSAVRGDSGVLIAVRDSGLGLSATDNLFVPFFTTKPGGSGIGLVLAQQIVEGHGGRLTLANREDRRGCVATIVLP
jgi:two-component system, NtrC family, nitrogen regulation sensor histidine kinase NtrY